MPPSTFTFTDLKSEVAASKHLRKGGLSANSEEKKGKSKSDWLKQNKGVNKRAARDVELREAELDSRSYESIVAKMEKKARIYAQLKRGRTGGLSDAQLAEQSVDWDAKAEQHYSSDSDHADDSSETPPDEDEEDPIIEYTDELGRQRHERRSKIPYALLPKAQEEDGGIVIENAHHHFPVYEPTAERLAKIEETLKDEELEAHYDASRNVRDHGAAHYAFSKGIEERARQRAELDQLHAEAQAARAATGAIDVKPGREGMQAEERLSGSAARKRKLEREERRKAIVQKRRMMSKDGTASTQTQANVTTPPLSSAPPSSALSTPPATNPIAIPKGKSKREDLEHADAFLASVEAELKRK